MPLLRAFTAFATAAIGALMLWRWADGSASALLQGWYLPILLATALALIALAALAAWHVLRAPADGATRGVQPGALISGALLLFPVALGLIYAPVPLGASDLSANRDAAFRFDPGGASEPASRNLYQWVYEFSSAEPATLVGQPVDLIAFVFHDSTEARADRFEAARFVVACCVADAQGFTLPVQWPAAKELRADQWVRIQGAVALAADGALVVRASSIDPLEAPSNPYIYP